MRYLAIGRMSFEQFGASFSAFTYATGQFQVMKFKIFERVNSAPILQFVLRASIKGGITEGPGLLQSLRQ